MDAMYPNEIPRAFGGTALQHHRPSTIPNSGDQVLFSIVILLFYTKATMSVCCQNI